MFENFQTENKLRPSFASLRLGTFPLRGRHEEDGNFCCLCGSKKQGQLPYCLKMFKQKTSCAPHSPRSCSALPPPVGRHEEADCFMQAREKEKETKIEKNL